VAPLPRRAGADKDHCHDQDVLSRHAHLRGCWAEWSHLRGRGPHYPLAFNANLEAKPMVAGILDAFEKK